MAISKKNYCKICHKNVGPRAHALQCDGCCGWVHIKCGKVPTAVYLLLTEHQVALLEVKCPDCKKKRCLPADNIAVGSTDSANSSLSSDSSDHDVTCVAAAPVAVSTPVHSSDEEPEDAPSPPAPSVPSRSQPSGRTYADVASISPKKHALGSKKPARTSRRTASSSAPVQELAARVNQLEKLISTRAVTDPKPDKASPTSVSHRPNREKCLIVFNAPESDKETPAERIVDDQSFLQRLTSTLFDAGEDGIHVVSAFRLGKKSDDPITSPRPLKVVLSSEDEARRVLSRCSRLKGLPYRVLRDLSPEDRIRMRQAVNELKQRKERGESNLHIVDFQVVTRRPRVVWQPLVILPRACHLLE